MLIIAELGVHIPVALFLVLRCKDANQHDPAKAVVRAVSFHPTGELLLAGGFDKSLRLFQVSFDFFFFCDFFFVIFF